MSAWPSCMMPSTSDFSALLFCVMRSATMLPMRPTFRLVSMPRDNSIVTKYSASNSGAMSANSTAAMPFRSPQRRLTSRKPLRRSILERFILPDRSCRLQRLAAGEIGHGGAHEVGYHRPFVVHPQHVLGGRPAGIDAKSGRVEIAGG